MVRSVSQSQVVWGGQYVFRAIYILRSIAILTPSRFDVQPRYDFNNTTTYTPAVREMQWTYCIAVSVGLQPRFVLWICMHVCTCFVNVGVVQGRGKVCPAVRALSKKRA